MNLKQLFGTTIVLAVMAMPMVANAQRRHDVRIPVRNVQHGKIEKLVNQAERASNSFRHSFEKMWDNHRDRNWARDWDRDWKRGDSSWNKSWDRSWRYSTRYSPKDAVQRMDEAMEKLRAAVDRDRSDSNRHDYVVGRDEMMEVLRATDNVDFYFGRGRNYNSGLDRQWLKVRGDIDTLARFYNLRAYGRW